MSTQSYIFVLGVGSALVAFWVCLRFPDLTPENFRRALIHVAIALGAGWVTPMITGVMFPQGLVIAMAALFAVLFPVLVYTFLSGAWVVKLTQERLSSLR
jgi:hypothetical protein